MSSRLSGRPLGFSGLDITPVGFGAWAYIDTIAAAIARAGAGAGPSRPAQAHLVAGI